MIVLVARARVASGKNNASAITAAVITTVANTGVCVEARRSPNRGGARPRSAMPYDTLVAMTICTSAPFTPVRMLT